MALKNRTESKAVVTNWAPVLDLEATHKPDLRDEILDNCLFRKDVASSDTAPSGTKTIDFLDIDYIAITQSTNVTYTLSNIQQGEIKYLKITKSVGQTIAFSGVIDTTPDTAFTTSQTTVLYQITNKDGSNIYATLISKLITDSTETIKGIVEKGTLVELLTGTADKNVAADNLKAYQEDTTNDFTAGLKQKIIEIGDWDMDALSSVSVAHGVDFTKIRTVEVVVRNDANTGYYTLNKYNAANSRMDGGVSSIDSTNIIIARGIGTSSIFDSTDFDTTSYNRGWITIKYTL